MLNGSLNQNVQVISCYGPGTMLGTGNRAADKADKTPYLGGAYRQYTDGTQKANKVNRKLCR